MKLFRNIYRMAVVCLMTVASSAAMADNSQIVLRTEPAGVNQIEAYDYTTSTYQSDGDTIVATVGASVHFSMYTDYGWSFVGLYDESGAVLLSENYGDVLTQPGEWHTYTARFEFNPANPGILPLGDYDRATATLTMEASYDLANGGYANSQQTLLALGHRYNLQIRPYNSSSSDKNPVDALKVIGQMDSYGNFAINLLYYFDSLRTIDLSETQGMTTLTTEYYYARKVTKLMLPPTMESVYSRAFEEFHSLQEIYLPAVATPDLQLVTDSFVVYGEHEDEPRTIYYSDITLYVPAGSLEDYQAHESWSKFFLQPIAGATAQITVVGIDNWLMAGADLTLLSDDGVALHTTVADTVGRYVFPNLPANRHYSIELRTADGEFVLADPVQSLLLTQDTVVALQMRPFGKTMARVMAGEQEVTDRCAIVWLDSLGVKPYGTGAISPLWPIGDSVLCRVTPLGEIATFFEPKDAGYRMEPSSNGLWIDLDRKDVGTADTVRIATGDLRVVSLCDASNKTGLIYDEAGNLVSKNSFVGNASDGTFVFTVAGYLPGSYTLVGIDEGPYASATRLEQLAGFGLTENADYIRMDFVIAGDSITDLQLQCIPETGAADSYISDRSHFYAGKAEVMASNTVQLTAEVEFETDDYAELSNLVYHIDLPDNLTIQENSVMIGNNAVSYSLSNNRLSVSAGMVNLASKEATRLRFMVIPTAPGQFYPSASVEYRYRNTTKTEPVGNAFFEAKAITISAPAVVLQTQFDATGYAPANALVRIVTASGDTLGTSYANARGFYKTTCLFEATETTDLTIHACAATPYASRLVSDTCVVRYDVAAPRPTDCFMTHQNGWYHRPMDVTWDFNSCTTSVSYYYYYHGEDFTFRTTMTAPTDSLVFVVIGQDGSKTVVPATQGEGNVWSAIKYFNTRMVPVRVDISYRYLGDMLYFQSCKSVSAIADPSGYIYEAVSSNRVEGVLAEAYFKQDLDSAEVLWDAVPYDQINPMYTDYAGAYGWDVPTGYWQVRFSKPGYEPVRTEWLPVPPPQLEINIPITRLSAPVVKQMTAHQDGLIIEFDRYMMPADLNSEMIQVSAGGNTISGSITLLNEEPRVAGDTVTFAGKLKFVPDAGELSGQLTVSIGACRSYAEVPMVPVIETVQVVPEVKNFGPIDTLELTIGLPFQRVIYALPAAAASGKTMRFDALGSSLYSLGETEAIINDEGAATIRMNGLVPGTSEVRITVDGTNLDTYVTVVVTEPVVYDIRFVNYDGTVLQHDTLIEGQTPVYAGQTPTRPATAQYTYTFNGWDAVISAAMANTVYTAQFDSIVNKYQITFVDEQGAVLQQDSVAYGQLPAYNGTTPTKAATAQYTYTFAGWSPEIATVTGNATYTATYSSTLNKYLISFLLDDGTVLQQDSVEYGVVPECAAVPDPIREATVQYTYSFGGWSPAVEAVSGDAVYTAIVDSVVNQYTISVTAEHGSISGEGTYDYGTEITLTATPDEGYKFVRWADEVTDNPRTITVSGDATYEAIFEVLSALENISGSPVLVYTDGRTLYVRGAETDYCVYSSDGKLLYRGMAEEVLLPQGGVYLVRLGRSTAKVIAR